MKFESGDKVRCISKDHTPWADNLRLIEIGKIYTVYGTATVDTAKKTLHVLMFNETNAINSDGPYYVEDDFESADVASTQDHDDAWDRAMGVL